MKWFKTRKKKNVKSSKAILPPQSENNNNNNNNNTNWKTRQFNISSSKPNNAYKLRNIHPIEKNLAITSVFDFRRIKLWKTTFRDYMYKLVESFQRVGTSTTNDEKKQSDPFVVNDDDSIIEIEDVDFDDPVQKSRAELTFLTKNLLTSFMFNCIMHESEKAYPSALQKTNFCITSEVKFGSTSTNS